MKAIKDKILELQTVSATATDFSNGWESMKKKIDEQDKIMEELELLAKSNQTLLGRIIRFPRADGYAIYVITKVNKKTVNIDWIDYSDGWIDPRCGKAASINIDYAKQEIDGQDALKKLFS